MASRSMPPPALPNASAASFLAARDFLLSHRTEYNTAVRELRWPVTISGKIRRVEWRTLEAERRARGGRAAMELLEDAFQ